MLSAETAASVNSELIKISSRLKIDTLIDQLKDLLTETWAKKTRAALISAIQMMESIRGPISMAELEEIEAKVSDILGVDYAAAVKSNLFDISHAAYLMGINEAAKELGASLMWNLPDTKALSILNKNSLWWIGEYYGDGIQEELKASMQDYFMGGYNRQQIATLMRVQYKDLISVSASEKGIHFLRRKR
jgi:hypothetical protein